MRLLQRRVRYLYLDKRPLSSQACPEGGVRDGLWAQEASGYTITHTLPWGMQVLIYSLVE